MTELLLNGLEVGAGAVGEGGRAVAQVVQADGWESGVGHEAAEAAGQVVRV
ncbi:hypothetical protein HDA31_004768 [Micromonospora carbonacea subsp. aurantiaca]|nr:hypothetical protein [Micromonospora carbonacea]